MTLTDVNQSELNGNNGLTINFNIINGTSGDDFLRGTPRPDRINGLAGNDTILGLSGNDLLEGGTGNDILAGGTGDDVLVGGVGKNASLDESMTPTIGLNFTSSTLLIDSFFIPPDTMGGVGPEHIVELINGRYSVYDKDTGTRVQTSSLNQFWNDSGVARSDVFDPRVIYDPFSERWFAVSAADRRSSESSFLLAVSNTSDPTEGWTGFAIDGDSANQRWVDFPTLGFDQDGVYLSANMFPITSGSVTTTIVAVPKVELLTATPTTTITLEFGELVSNSASPPNSNSIEPAELAPLLSDESVQNITGEAGTVQKNNLLEATATNIRATVFENNSRSETGLSVQPVVDLDNTDLPAVLLSAFNTPEGVFKRSNITGDIFSPRLDTSNGLISVEPFLGRRSAEQPGPKQNIEVVSPRFVSNLVLKNGSIWGVQSIDNNGRSALRWFEIDEATNTLIQEGLIADADLEFYYGSIAINDSNDIVIGFSGSSENQFVSSFAVVGETVGGNTTFGEPLLLKEGVADYEVTFGAGRNRWGDYSATVVDPSDPNRFWTFQEFVSAEDIWSTQITEIILTEVAGGQDLFQVRAAEGTDIILDFGGVGRGTNPPQDVIEEVDTIQFSGSGLIARNMLLTQQGQNLEITFAGDEKTKVILQDFALEDLENLPNGIGNILFDGQQQIQDDFDVIDADANPRRVSKRNTVTFFNDLDNNTQGFDNSNDVINGQGGNDTLFGKSGNDLIRGGDGNDTIWGQAGNDSVTGGNGRDRILGNNGSDTLKGGNGIDTLFGGNGNDLVFGNAGNDQVIGNAGNDSLFGGLNNDILFGYAGEDQLFGEAGNDVLWGQADNDFLAGGAGTDVLYGNNGHDVLGGGDGADSLFGNAGNDFLAGNTSNDTLFGNNGNDILYGGQANDTLWGGAGNDFFELTRGPNVGVDRVKDYTDGADKFLLSNRFGLGSLKFSDLSFTQKGDNAQINIARNNQLLAILENTNVAQLDSNDFVTV